MSLAPITGDGVKLAAQAADQTQKTTPVQEFQGILKNGLNTIKEDMDSIFEEASALYQIPSKLLRAVAKAESGFNPKAVSKAGAMGVMQLMPGTASWSKRSLQCQTKYPWRGKILKTKSGPVRRRRKPCTGSL
mgnify:CR=1 FL=1